MAKCKILKWQSNPNPVKVDMLTYDSPKLGKWNLSDLVSDSSSEQVELLVSNIKSKVIRFEEMKSHLKNDISTEDFVRMIRMIEEISEALSILGGFAHLQYYSNTLSNDAAAFVTKIEKFISEMENRMIFFDLWF
jgi:oligoendopeptidase F